MKNELKKNRIWELDALRGIAILCVVCVHTIFDLVYMFRVRIDLPAWYVFVQEYGGALFVVLSGVCVTLGHKCIKRGLIVFGAGMAITLVTFLMGKIDASLSSLLITFGVLHLIGVCMMTYPLYRKLPWWLAAVLGAVIVVLGYWFATLHGDFPLCEIIGLKPVGYTAGDYFPLFPYLGWFMIGTALGKTVYKEKKTLLPGVPAQVFPLNFFCFCGRQSLWIYLAHQPLVYGVLYLIFIVLK